MLELEKDRHHSEHSDDDDCPEHEDHFDFWDFIILRCDSSFMIIWQAFYLFTCIASSYFYAYSAAFGFGSVDHGLGNDDDYHRWMIDLDHACFSIFTVDIIINFLTEFVPVGDQVPCRNLEDIVKRYLQNSFIFHFLTWFPFHYIINFDQIHGLKWLFLIKIFRLYEAFTEFDVSKIMKFVNKKVMKWTEW